MCLSFSTTTLIIVAAGLFTFSPYPTRSKVGDLEDLDVDCESCGFVD
jgi:hypothetical protein